MASIRYNPNGQKGRISYNTDIVSGIIALSLQETEGIELVPSRSKGIKVNFEKRVSLQISPSLPITVTACRSLRSPSSRPSSRWSSP